MPLLYGTTLKPFFKDGLVLFFVLNSFLLCLVKNKVLILYSYVKLAAYIAGSDVGELSAATDALDSCGGRGGEYSWMNASAQSMMSVSGMPM